MTTRLCSGPNSSKSHSCCSSHERRRRVRCSGSPGEDVHEVVKQRLLSLALALSPEGVALVALRTDLLLLLLPLCLQVLREISTGSFSSQ
jgi:hypothetical protein